MGYRRYDFITKMKISEEYRKMAEVYKIFASDEEVKNDFDFSEEALTEMYVYESTGKGDLNSSIFESSPTKKINGYFVGKKYLNITVAIWMENIKKYGFIKTVLELYKDPSFPHWWLNLIFKNKFYLMIREVEEESEIKELENRKANK